MHDTFAKNLDFFHSQDTDANTPTWDTSEAYIANKE